MKKWLVLSLLVFSALCCAMEDGESPEPDQPNELFEESLKVILNKVDQLKDELKEVKEYLCQEKNA